MIEQLQEALKLVAEPAAENRDYLVIGWVELGISVMFVMAAGALSLWQNLQLTRSLLIGTIRTFIQLIAVGFLIKFIFRLESPWLVLGYFAVTAVVAAQVVRGAVKEKGTSLFLPTLLTILSVGFIITWSVVGIIVGAHPWWEPQYFVPLGGMISGNVMSAVSIGLRKWFEGMRSHRQEVEMKLVLGATPAEASANIFRESLKLAMMPTITGMMSVGLVQLPGMMTGQILAGAAPGHAVRYQIVVMLMLTASTAFGSFLALYAVRKKSFGALANIIVSDRESEKN